MTIHNHSESPFKIATELQLRLGSGGPKSWSYKGGLTRLTWWRFWLFHCLWFGLGVIGIGFVSSRSSILFICRICQMRHRALRSWSMFQWSTGSAWKDIEHQREHGGWKHTRCHSISWRTQGSGQGIELILQFTLISPLILIKENQTINNWQHFFGLVFVTSVTSFPKQLFAFTEGQSSDSKWNEQWLLTVMESTFIHLPCLPASWPTHTFSQKDAVGRTPARPVAPARSLLKLLSKVFWFTHLLSLQLKTESDWKYIHSWSLCHVSKSWENGAPVPQGVCHDESPTVCWKWWLQRSCPCHAGHTHTIDQMFVSAGCCCCCCISLVLALLPLLQKIISHRVPSKSLATTLAG